MAAYIGANGYYEGDREHALDQEVPKRPHSFDTWDGKQWVPGQDPALAAENVAASAERVRDEQLDALQRHFDGKHDLDQDEINRAFFELLKERK